MNKTYTKLNRSKVLNAMDIYLNGLESFLTTHARRLS
jgi:hypothetical protein